MSEELNIISRVLEAQHNIDKADDLIRDYFPFIKSETAKTIGRIPVEGKDDELSIALMGFHEAIESYNREKGAFLSFASLVIKRRIIDFLRHENQFRQHVSLEDVMNDEERYNINHISEEDEVADRETLKWEIKQLTDDLRNFGITFSDVAKNSPKYEKSVKDCRKAVNYLTDNPEIMRVLFETGKLPIKQIAGETLVKRKTLEKHRKYLVTVSVIYFKGYDCMIEHLAEVFKFTKGGK